MYMRHRQNDAVTGTTKDKQQFVVCYKKDPNCSYLCTLCRGKVRNSAVE